jgi:hypothetical protein
VSGFVSGFVVVVELPIVCVLIEMDGWMDWLVVVGGGWWWLVVVGGGWWCMWFFSWLVVWLMLLCDFALVFCFDTHIYTYTTTTAYM